MNDAQKFFEDVKNLIKAIGTSSSINEERDERSVENYVRTGGNIMENTTEPDPKGDIAVTKVIGSATNPNGDISVSDAPEGTVPTSATIPSDATSAVAPSKTDEVNTPETVTKAEAGKCASCGQSLPVEKSADSDEITETVEKAAICSDCGKKLDLCDCMGKAVDAESKEEDAKETPADEKTEVKKSIWGGAFAPRK
jgi:hypothetical protein